MAARIAGTGAYLPARRVDNQELAKTVDTSAEWIFSHTGINARHLAADDEATSDLACYASRQALERAGIAAEDVGMIIVATTTPDFAAMPATACVVQEKLGVARSSGAFDLIAACSGFTYALEVGRGC